MKSNGRGRDILNTQIRDQLAQLLNKSGSSSEPVKTVEITPEQPKVQTKDSVWPPRGVNKNLQNTHQINQPQNHQNTATTNRSASNTRGSNNRARTAVDGRSQRWKERYGSAETQSRPSPSNTAIATRSGSRSNSPSNPKPTIKAQEYFILLNSVYGPPPSKATLKRTGSAQEKVQNAPKEQPVKFSTLREMRLAREAEFKEPDAWVKHGVNLQPPNSTPERTVSIRIGIDFGTSFTKVAISAFQKVFFITWEGVHQGGNNWLLPGEISELSDGDYRLGRSANAKKVHANLKLPFLEGGNQDIHASIPTVAFMAWVMRYCRAWIYKNLSSLLTNRRIAWEVNIGCPTNTWTMKSIKSAYQHLALSAWKLSQDHHGINIATSTTALNQTSLQDAHLIGLDAMKLMPEFIAQLAGYVRSPQRKDGLHMLMDIGAGTVDIAIFNIMKDHEDGADRFPIFASDVQPQGTHFLMSARLNALGIESWDDFSEVPSREILVADPRVNPVKLDEADREFSSRVKSLIAQIISYTKRSRYKKAEEWSRGLPTFLAGGGSLCDIYRKSLTDAFTSLHLPLVESRFPMIEESAAQMGLTKDNFHRVSVAYGLTFDAEDVGRILSPHEIPNDSSARTVNVRADLGDMYLK